VPGEPIKAEDLVGEEWAEWYRMTPVERFRASERLWETYLALGGLLEPEPDTQSPFYLWTRRTSIEVDNEPIDILSLQDLMHAKKTQRDKDWPMITRLMERSYFGATDPPQNDQATLWLRELRTPELLLEVAAAHPEIAQKLELEQLRKQRRADLP
jgi:hypothetical protein